MSDTRSNQSSEDESNDLNFEYSSSGSSSSDDLVDIFPGEGSEDEELVAVPEYNVEFGLYEPLAEEGDIDDDDDEMEIDESRLDDKEKKWCDCGHCEIKPSFKLGDYICCREIPEVRDETDRQGSACITTAEAFGPAILHPISLYIGWLEYTDKWRQDAKSWKARQNEKYRYVAYRKLVRWCWGWLGKNVRVQLPACAHARIMEEYPDAGGQYRGTELRHLKVD